MNVEFFSKNNNTHMKLKTKRIEFETLPVLAINEAQLTMKSDFNSFISSLLFSYARLPAEFLIARGNKIQKTKNKFSNCVSKQIKTNETFNFFLQVLILKKDKTRK
jgi:hypothetical protein